MNRNDYGNILLERYEDGMAESGLDATTEYATGAACNLFGSGC